MVTAPKRRRLRRAGSRWRILAYQILPGGGGGDAYHVGSAECGPGSTVTVGNVVYHQRHTVLPETELDEVVIGQWLHLEQMDTGSWWMNVGGVVLRVQADRDGRPKHVMVEHEHDVDGCTYEVDGRPAGGQR